MVVFPTHTRPHSHLWQAPAAPRPDGPVKPAPSAEDPKSARDAAINRAGASIDRAGGLTPPIHRLAGPPPAFEASLLDAIEAQRRAIALSHIEPQATPGDRFAENPVLAGVTRP